MIVLLLDMDGVLLEPHGYHRALVDTVKTVGRAFGFPGATLSPEDIATFEAAGISSEWDSAAACAALMLVDRWQWDREFKLPGQITTPPANIQDFKNPPFGAFARALTKAQDRDLPAMQRVEKAILEQVNHLSTSQIQTIQNLLINTTSAEHSVVHRTFQEFVLGSQVYAKFYPYPAVLDTESYLLQYDHPNLSPAEQARLHQWRLSDERDAAILTLRPSQPPGGEVFSTPEAEMGAQRVGLEGLPIAGRGGLLWLARKRNFNPDFFGKPSPVHALTALRLVMGDSLENALTASASLALDHFDDGGWKPLHGAQLKVYEDTTTGLKSALAAADILRAYDISLLTYLYGVTVNPAKQNALKSAGADAYSSLSDALRNILLPSR